MEALEPFPKTWFARIAAAVGLLTGLIVLSGWLFQVTWLTSIVPSWPKMASLTAVGVTVASASLWLIAAGAFASCVSPPAHARSIAVVARILAALALCIGIVGLTTRLAGWNVRLEALTMERMPVSGVSPAGSMQLATATCFILLGSALLLVQHWRWRYCYQGCALLVMVIGWLGLSRFVYGGAALVPYAAMAIHTSAVLLVLGAGALALRRDFGLMALLTSRNAGGASLRMLLPATVLVPLVTGSVILSVANQASHAATVSLFALSIVVMLALAVWFNAAWLERSDLERRAAQDALSASKERLRLIIEGALDAVISMDLAGMITGWNPQAEAMFGWRAHEVLGRELAELVIPEPQRAAHRRGLQHIASGGTSHLLNRRVELQAVRRDQQQFPIELAVVPIVTAQGTAFSAFVRDISEQRKTLQALQIGEANLREQLGHLQLLDTTTRAIRERQDLRSIFQVVLRSLEESLPVDFGCMCLYESATPLLTVSCVGLKSQALGAELALSDRSRIYVDQHHWSACVRGEFVHEPDAALSASPFCMRLVRAGLRSLIFAPLLVEGSVFGVVIVARQQAHSFNITECEFLRQLSEHVALAGNQAQLYAALQRAYEDLRNSQQSMLQQERLRAIGQMASGIAHDINNALSPAGLYVQLLLEREVQLGARARSQLEVVRRAIENVSETVTRMRTVYQPQESALQPAALDANEILRQVVELTRARWTDMAHQRGITIALNLELLADLPRIATVESELRDALTNLVLNAVDAMPKGGTLTLRTGRMVQSESARGAGDEVCLEVIDTGIGMDEQQRARCLEPFYTTKGQSGSGLGLAMVYGMVQRHSARLQIESEPGRGTTMRLIFPAASVHTATQSVIAPDPLQRQRILLIDDDPLILESLGNALTEDGHQLIAVDGGKAGMETFVSAERGGQRFTVVITDLGMPHVDGRKVAAAIKAVAPRTPIIMLTGWGHQMQADNDKPAHVDCVLSKPPRLAELRRVLAELAS